MSRVAGVVKRFVWGRRLLLGCVLAVGLAGSFCPLSAAAQTAEANGIVDTWQGTLHAGQQNLRTVLKISKDDKGVLQLAFYSIDQGGQPIAASAVSFSGGVLTYGIERIDLKFEGKMSSDGKSITGTSKQGDQAIPIVFERATAATAWTIPEPRKPVPQWRRTQSRGLRWRRSSPLRRRSRASFLASTGARCGRSTPRCST